MTNVTINLPTEFDFRRSGVVFRCEPGKLPTDIIQQLVLHGIVQKVGDSAAGKEETAATAAMQSTWDTLVSGDWGKTRSGESDPLASYRQGVMRDLLKNDDDQTGWKTYRAIKDAKARVAHLDQLIADQDDDMQAWIEESAIATRDAHMAEIDRRKRQAAEAASGMKLKLIPTKAD